MNKNKILRLVMLILVISVVSLAFIGCNDKSSGEEIIVDNDITYKTEGITENIDTAVVDESEVYKIPDKDIVLQLNQDYYNILENGDCEIYYFCDKEELESIFRLDVVDINKIESIKKEIINYYKEIEHIKIEAKIQHFEKVGNLFKIKILEKREISLIDDTFRGRVYDSYSSIDEYMESKKNYYNEFEYVDYESKKTLSNERLNSMLDHYVMGVDSFGDGAYYTVPGEITSILVSGHCKKDGFEKVTNNTIYIKNGETHILFKKNTNVSRNRDEYIFDFSSDRKITMEDLNNMDSNLIPYARNEIFARHGYMFQTEKYREYFSDRSWYHPNPNFDANILNEVERYNVDFIKRYEDGEMTGSIYELDGVNDTTSLKDGKYRVSLSNVDKDNKGTYLELQTEVHYSLVYEYTERCEQELGIYASAEELGEFYYINNFPVEVIEDGQSKLINVQELRDRTDLYGSELYEGLFYYYSISSGSDIFIFDELKGETQKVYLSSNCEFDFTHLIPYIDKSIFKDNIEVLEKAFDESNGTIELIEVIIKDNKIVKITKIFRP
ncbi:MAG: YARHG domain-containing protein [bacterium]